MALILIFGVLCFFYGKSIDKLDVKEGYYAMQGYSFKIPEGWQETNELGPIAFLNVSENNGDNPFKSYVFLISEELKGRSPKQYFDYIKAKVKESSENVEILEEKDEGSFHIIIAKVFENENEYIIAMALRKGVSDTYFVVSLNSLESNWETTKPIFEETYRSFKLR